MSQKSKKQKIKTGVCEVHLYNEDDNKKRKVKWSPECGLWVCDECNDPLLKVMASVSKKNKNKK